MTPASTLRQQVGFLARRSVKRTFRQPALIIPTIVFPLFLLAVNSNGLRAVVHIPGFPTDNYLNFAITVAFMQAGLFSATTAGAELATDIESGFLDRLQLTPMRASAILAGQLAGAVAVALFASIVFLCVGLATGVTIKAGVGGAVLLILMAVLVAVAFGAIGAVMAARTGNAQAVQGLFPLLFVTFFLSSNSLPRNLIQIHWFRTIATWNPVSYMVEGLRSLIIFGWDSTALLRGFGVTAVVTGLALAAASASLKTRMART